MDFLRNIEEQFNSIHTKINTKTELIRRNYDNENSKIKEQFSDLQEVNYKNGINQYRDSMLKQIWDQRNEQLKQVDNLKSRVHSLSEFKSKVKTIKSSNLSFARSLVQIYESILFRSKFESLFDLQQFLNFSKFISTKRSFDLTAVKEKIGTKSCTDRWFKLTSDLVFVVCSSYIGATHKDYMSIINEKGEIIRHKLLKDFGTGMDFLLKKEYFIKANTTNIIVFYRNSAPSASKPLIDIYNFELELIYSFNLDNKFRNHDIMLNNYEIVLFHLHGYNGISLSCFNYENTRFKQKDVRLDTSSFIDKSFNYSFSNKFSEFSQDSDSPSLELQHMNDEFVYLFLTDSRMRRSTLLIFDRVKYENLFKFVNFSISCRVLMHNSEIGLIGDGREFIAYKIKSDKSYIETVCKTKNLFQRIILAPYNKTILTEFFYSIENSGKSRLQFYEW